MNGNLIESDWRAILKHEFEAGENSFLIQLRCGPGWNKEAYLRLFVAMRECCKAHDGQAHIERWIAQGFWYLDFYARFEVERVKGRSHHYDSDYYENAAVNLNHLAHWLFVGEGRRDEEFEPLE